MSSRLYYAAARVIRELESKRGSLASLVFTSSRVSSSSKKKLYAIVSQTIKHKEIILHAIEECQLTEKESEISLYLAMVLTYELLFGKGLKGGGQLKRAMMRHKDELERAVKDTRAVATVQHRSEIVLPRYARVNLLKTTVVRAMEALSCSGYTRATLSAAGEPKSEKEFHRDVDMPELLVFRHSVHLTEHPLYQSGDIILQDKASCLPALLLRPPPGSSVVDACAAPGNKTTHLAALMRNQGTIFAFDKDYKRFLSLKEMVKKSGATCVQAVCKDFLQVDVKDHPNTEYILVDPSCSGSGIVNRVEIKDKEEVDLPRLRSLSRFQAKILAHALSFPKVKRVLYSTCSVHKEENEGVVTTVLKDHSNFELVHLLPKWKTRGSSEFLEGEKCVRCTPHDHGTNGFFLALIVRRD